MSRNIKSVGNESTMSTNRIINSSAQPPAYALTVPKVMPIEATIVVVMKPICMLIVIP